MIFTDDDFLESYATDRENPGLLSYTSSLQEAPNPALLEISSAGVDS